MANPAHSRWLIVGASGLLGHALARHLVARGHTVIGVHHRHPIEVEGVTAVNVNVLEPAALERLIDSHNPTVVVYAAGLTDVDACERDESLALRIHASVAAELAKAARSRRFVYISTDHLWSGTQSFVCEETPPHPLNAYARTKWAGEQDVLEAHADALVVRTNFFGRGPSWRFSISDWIVDGLASGRRIDAFDDVFFTPISSVLLSTLIERAVASDAGGVYHLCGGERVSKFEFARRLAAARGYADTLIRPVPIASVNLAAPRPRDMSLCTKKAERLLGAPMPKLDDSFSTLAT